MSADTINGLGGNDLIYGYGGDDLLNGGGGADTLYGGLGNDTLDGGADNDSLNGDAGNDTYVMSRGMGQDTVVDLDTTAGNIDTVKVATGIAVADVKVTRDASNLYLSINGTTDKLTMTNWSEASNQVERVQFADGTVWDASILRSMARGVITEGADSLFGDNVMADTISGLGGNDTIYGYGGADLINGGSGADTLYGGDGNDTLDGGADNDILKGDVGSDTYLMYRGAGQDQIDDFDTTVGNTDVLKFGSGIATDQIWFRKIGTDLEVSVIGTNDKFTISKWDFWGTGSWATSQHVEQFVTADGKMLSDTKVNQLIQAMASFSPPAAGQTTLPANYQSALQPTLAASWV